MSSTDDSAHRDGQPLTHPIRLAAVDDDRMLLEGLASWFRGAADLTVVAQAPTVSRLARSWPPHGVDVVLLDVRLRDDSLPGDNVRALRALGAQVLAVTAVPEPLAALTIYEAGALGYLTKDHDLPALLAAIRIVASGETAWSVELASAWIAEANGARVHLARQEREVLAGYAAGMTLYSAARAAGVKPATAKTYLDRIREKYRAAGRPAPTKLELAQRAAEDGYLDPGS